MELGGGVVNINESEARIELNFYRKCNESKDMKAWLKPFYSCTTLFGFGNEM